MKGIAINLYFQLQLSSVFLCNSIPLGPLYFNGLKFSSLCNSEKNSIHLHFLHTRPPLSLLAFQRVCLSFPEENWHYNFLNGPWFALMMSFKGSVLLLPLEFLCLLSCFFFLFFFFLDGEVNRDTLWQPWQKGHTLQASFLQQHGASAPPAHSHSASLYGCHRRRTARCWPQAGAARKRSE